MSQRIFPFAALLLLVSGVDRAVAQQNVQFLPNINLVAGTGAVGYTGDGGLAVNATLANAVEAAIPDPFGNVYIADSANNVVRRVDAVTGIITTFAGGAKTVCAAATDKYGNGCPALGAILVSPQGIRYYKGDIYIVDNGDNEIRVVSGTTGIISDFYGTGGTALSVAGKAANATAVNAPVDIVFDTAGNAYVPSAGGKPFFTKVAATTGLPGTGIVSIVAGNGTAGNTGDGGPASAAEIQAPTGAAIDPQGNIYVGGGTPNTIREINIATGIINTVVGPSGGGTAGYSGDGGPANLAQLNSPQHFSFDGFGNLYIADFKNHRIRVVSPPVAGATYGIINTIVGNSTAGTTGNGGPAVNALLTSPRDAELTAAGDLLITDGGTMTVRLVSPPSLFPATNVGATSSQTASINFIAAITPSVIGVPAGYPDFSDAAPTGCATGTAVTIATVCSVPLTFQPVAAGNRIAPFVVQSGTGTKDVLPLIGLGNAPAAAVLPGVISGIAGTGKSGNAGDNAAATAALLSGPQGTAVDGQNNYYFADTANNEIREIAASTGVITRVAGTGTAGFSGDGGAATSAKLSAPSSVAVDGAGNLYISDTGNNRIRFVSAATGLISTFAGNGVLGYAGDMGPATAAQLTVPQGLYLYPTGVLYIADTGNNVIRTVGVRSGFISTVAGNGTAGYLGDTGQSVLAELNAPTGVTVDSSGNIYIADTGNQIIRKVTNGIITTFAGAPPIGGVPTVGYSDGAAATAMFHGPTALAVDAAADLYIADMGNNAIRRISGGQSTTVAGTGTAGATGNGGSSTSALLSGPRGLALDLNGNILIGDTANNMLRGINVSAATLTFPNTSPNTSSAAQTVSVTDAGNLALNIASVTPPVGYSEQASGGVDCNGAGVSLNPGSACLASIVFMPTAAQTYSGNVVVTDNSQNQAAATQNIAVTGIAAYVFTATISAPSSVVAGVSQTVTVTVTKPGGLYTGTVHFTSSDPKAVLPADYTFTAADNGKHVFTGVQFGTAAASAETITVTDKTDPTVTATALVTVVGGPAASFAIVSGNLQSGTIFTKYTNPLIVKALDSNGNASANQTVTFTAPASGADVSFTGGAATYTGVTNALGLITSPVPMADGVIGTFAVTVTAPGATPASFSLTNISTLPLGFTLTSALPTLGPIAPGNVGTATIILTPVGGFNAPVNVACSGAIATTTCILSESTVPANGTGNPSNFILTITTMGPVNASASLSESHKAIYACLLLLTGCTLRKRRKLQGIVLALLCGIALASLSGCGGSTTYTTQTLPGTFTVTVTGTSGSLSNTLMLPVYVAGEP